MTEIKAQVVEFDLLPHPNADILSIAKIRNKEWQCVVKTSDMVGKSIGIYIPIDALVPTSKPEFSFLADKSKSDGTARIKTIRLRQKISQGLLINAPEGSVVGDDFTEALGVTRWEPAIPAMLAGDMVREPGNFQKYTSIENYKNFPNVFTENDDVVITEKCHGCLRYDTRVKLATGDKKTICEIKIGDEVLGLDNNGNLVPSKVLTIFKHDKTNDWLNICITRKNVGRGSGYNTIKCTPNHQFWIPAKNTYVPASELKTGDFVLTHRIDIEHTPVQEQVILGTLLGDAHISLSLNLAKIEFGHVTKDIEYFRLKQKVLGDIYYKDCGEFISGYGSEMIRGSTVSTASIRKKFYDFVDGEKKRVPEWVINELTPLALAFWYMDDGSLGHNDDQEDRASFAVCNFTKEDCEILIRALKKFNINAIFYISHNKNNSKDHSRLRLNADDAEKLFLIVAPYIPPCMQRKLPERYRGHAGWIPDGGKYKKKLVEQEIVEINKLNNSAYKYDIETETHNFFANGVLVHNSNSRFGLINDGTNSLQYYVGTHKTARDKNGTNLYSKISQSLDIETKLRLIVDDYKPTIHFIIFGEIYGSGVQDLRYDCEVGEQKLRLFDVLIDHQYQPWVTVETIAKTIGIETVPVLYRGKYSITKAMELREGKTTLGGAHIREGIVVKSDPEDYDPEIGRKIIKFISDEYLLRKNATDGH